MSTSRSNTTMPKLGSASENAKPRNKIKAKQKDDDLAAQFDSKMRLGRKGNQKKRNQVSLNHLLNFQSYRDAAEFKNQHSHTRKPNSGRAKHRALSGGKDAYKAPLTGMSFINLNYKFVVDYRGNYKPQELDPNLPVSRADIIRIIAPSGNSCPICLTTEFVAPRMITSCGHIICLKCLISLLDTEVPTTHKRESSAVVEKYRECPLCFSVIRKGEVKPVLIREFDERFETPQVNDDVVMTLMTRPHHRLFAVPRAIEGVHYQIDQIPFVDSNEPDLSSYARIFKADFSYIQAMYDTEKAQILDEYDTEKALYNDNGKFVRMAISQINEDIASWAQKYNEYNAADAGGADYASFDQSLSSSNTYFYYEAGFNASASYVLAPLDIKVLKTNFNNDYSQCPSSIVVRVENIQYEELTEESSLKRFKYLSHLPIGTTIAFMQCDWSKSSILSAETWEVFKDDLTKRSKKTQRKLQREERDKVRALNEEERRSKLFFERENNKFYNHNVADESEYEVGNVGGLTIIDNRSLPSLAGMNDEAVESDESHKEDYHTTIWGTRIPKSDLLLEEEDDSHEMIRKAKEEMNRQEQENPRFNKNKKKKKLVLLSSSSYS